MFAFNDILQKIEQEITRLQFTYPAQKLIRPNRVHTFTRWKKNPSGTRTDGM